MSGPLAPIPLAGALLLALAVLVGLVRLWLRRGQTPPATRGPLWRTLTLSLLQAGVGASLYLMLFTAPAPSPGGVGDTLVIATAGAPKAVPLGPGERLVALPEAGALPRAERAPDLATALRRHPNTTAIRVVGHGLAPRDRGAVSLPLAFTPAPPPQGLVALALPEATAAGTQFEVSGQVGNLPQGVVELIDPAGAVASQAPIKAGESFRLSGKARAPGLILFELRLRDQAGRLIERVDIPIDAAPRPQPRVLILAGAPGAEIKFLGRWAQAAGIETKVEIEAGGGLRLGEIATPLNRANLDAIDLVVVDNRRWEELGPAAQSALLDATGRGMGLLLRLTTPPSPDLRRAWAGLGFTLPEQDDEPVPWGRDPAPDESGRADGTTDLPEPTQLPLPEAPGVMTLLDGAAAWTPRGQGRIGLVTIPDSYVLFQSGRPERHGQLWSRLFTSLARPAAPPAARLAALPRAGERVVLCGLAGPATVTAPEGQTASPLIDPASGLARCAGFWPAQPGWSVARSQERETAFYVHPAGAAPGVAAAEATQATLALVAAAEASPPVAKAWAPGAPWPWFILVVALLSAAWWLERAAFGRQGRAPTP